MPHTSLSDNCLPPLIREGSGIFSANNSELFFQCRGVIGFMGTKSMKHLWCEPAGT